MPTIEPIADTIMAKPAEKPIPVRVISTKAGPPKAQVNQPPTQNENQETTVKSDQGAESPTTEESVKLSPQLSALARKEQAFRQREQALKQREKDLEAKLSAADEFTQLKEKLGAKDFSDAEKLGLNYEEYVQYKLDQANGEDPNAKALKTLEQRIQDMEKEKEESAKREFTETVNAYKKEIVSAVSTNPEYSTIKGKGKEGHVLQLILDSWNEDGIEMTVDEACKDIESALVEDAKSYLELPKFKTVEESKKLPPPKPGVRTLTNQMQPSGVESKPATSLHKLSDAERYAEARRRMLARKQQGA